MGLAANALGVGGVEVKVGRKHIARRQPEDVAQQRQRARNAAGRLQCVATIAAFMRI
jgi:hypothetical protein